jgi:hypothetical protein
MTRRMRVAAWFALLALDAVACSAVASTVPSPTPIVEEHAGHASLAPGAIPVPDQHSASMTLLASVPKPDHSPDFYNSDLAFWGDLAVQGSYDGFRILDISTPIAPLVIADVSCRGPQGDVSIWRNLVVVSIDRPQTSPGCDSVDAITADPTELSKAGGWEGLRIFDVSRPAGPRLTASVRTDCGSHTHTLVPDEANDRLVVYVSSFAILQDASTAPGCMNPHGHISVVEIPLADPASARVVGQPRLVDTPEWQVFPGAPPDFHPTTGCHDISVYLRLHLAAAACMSEGQIWDVSDLEHPRTLAHVDVPEVGFWHSAAWSNDGSVVAFGDENLADAGCGDAPNGAIWFYRVDDPASPRLAGHFSLARQQGAEICSAHMFNVVPGIGRNLLISAFYTGGTSVIDFTDPDQPQEIAFYDVGGLEPGDEWAAYWYRGRIYASDHLRGLDIFALDLPAVTDALALPHLDPQLQE